MAGALTFFDCAPGGLTIRVRLRPAGRVDGVQGLGEGADGQIVLKASVTKPPEDGKANQALIKLLTKEWKVAKSALQVLQGQTSRNKVLRIAGDTAELKTRLEAWVVKKGFQI